MNRRTGLIIVIVLFMLQFIQNLYFASQWFLFDFLYLVIIYISLKSSLVMIGITATTLGLIADFMSGGVLGVFGFSRTLVAFFIAGMLNFIDLKKGIYVFLIITISLSFSNLIANFLMFLISRFTINFNFVFFQPVFTGLFGYLLLKNRSLKKYLDVY